MNEDRVFLFRVGSAFAVLGVSLICFLLGGLSKERSSGLFAAFHALCAGVMLGMGFLFDDPDGIAHFNHESKYSAVYIASISFVGMVGIEYFNATSTYGYSAVLMIEEGDDETGMELSRMGNGASVHNEEYEDESGFEIVQRKDLSVASQLMSKSFKFHPLILLFFASASDMVGGIHLSCEEHYSVQLFVVVIIHKALMSCAFGTLLESSTAPRSVFLYFMLTYCSSSAVGMLTGTFMSSFGYVTPHLLSTMQHADLVITALTAGVYLFIATLKMIPAGLSTDPASASGETTASSIPQDEKLVRFALFVAGFAFAVVPKLVLP